MFNCFILNVLCANLAYAWLLYTNNRVTDHSPDNVKFPNNFLMVRGTLAHVKCYSYHAGTSVIVSGGGRNATVHDPKPK